MIKPASTTMARPKVMLVDMSVARNSPAGSCVLAEVQEIKHAFDVTVMSTQLDETQRDGVRFVHAAAPGGPVLLRYLVFHAMVWCRYMAWRLAGGDADIVQATQGQLIGADVSYAHFCHRAYLRTLKSDHSITGIRRWMRWGTHWFNAWAEARAFRRARLIVAPSMGLARELAHEYGLGPDKVKVLANPVAIDRFTRPDDFDRDAQRQSLGFAAGHVVLSFMALGDFSRKGLGLLLQALAQCDISVQSMVRVLVIGGKPDEIDEFEQMAASLGVGRLVSFVGLQNDVRPFLWASDVFAFPSAYEIFSLAILQAAAAGLPVLVSEGLYGAEEFVVHGDNGWLLPRRAEALAPWLMSLSLLRPTLGAMGERARQSVQRYSQVEFGNQWRALLSSLSR